jgi:hypothetical protein
VSPAGARSCALTSGIFYAAPFLMRAAPPGTALGVILPFDPPNDLLCVLAVLLIPEAFSVPR